MRKASKPLCSPVLFFEETVELLGRLPMNKQRFCEGIPVR